MRHSAERQPEPGADLLNKLTSVTAPPLQIGGADQGVTYNPGNALNISTTSVRETYYRVPRFYIADIGQSADATGEVYRIDAVGYGGNPTAVAVVESTFVVRQGVVDRGYGNAKCHLHQNGRRATRGARLREPQRTGRSE